VAAADPRIHDQVRLVFSFGAYYDALSVLGAITDRHVRYGTVDSAWEPHPWTIQVFAEQIVHALPEGEERTYLEEATADPAAVRERAPPPLSPLGRMVYDLLFATGAVDGQQLLAALPPETRADFTAVSPATHVQGLRARMIVMHDTGDTLIPFTESRRLVDALPPAVPRRYAEFSMFEHVMPRDPSELLFRLADLAELYQMLYMVFFALTD
jgi:hypothetical protein